MKMTGLLSPMSPTMTSHTDSSILQSSSLISSSIFLLVLKVSILVKCRRADKREGTRHKTHHHDEVEGREREGEEGEMINVFGSDGKRARLRQGRER
jgi:hypothetical protein